jgi:hypothetical protein
MLPVCILPMKRVVPFLVILSVALLGLSWVIFASPGGAPRKLALSMGGFDGPCYRVTLLANGKLEYVSAGGGFTNAKAEQHSVTGAQWRQFRSDLDAVGIWKWQRTYEDLILDGTQWAVEITYPDAAILSNGSNNYPGKGGKASGSPKVGQEFTAYLAAVEKLLGKERRFR